MIRLLFLALIAGIWFYAIPLWDMFTNQSRMNTAILHWFSTPLGTVVFVAGALLSIWQSIMFFAPAKKKAARKTKANTFEFGDN